MTINSAISTGSRVTVNYTAKNNGNIASGPFNVDVWSDSALAPAIGATGQSVVQTASLAAGASVTGSVTIANASVSGTAYAIVDTLNTVGEGIETNNVSAGVGWVRPPLAPFTYNFENSLVPADMVMSGTAAWLPSTSGNGNKLVFALKAGGITHSQTSCVEVSAAGSTSASFSYNVSSEASFDFLRFYIDGVQKASWSGSVAWTASPTYTVTTGLHVFKWCYAKDAVGTAGSDTAWIDNVVIN